MENLKIHAEEPPSQTHLLETQESDNDANLDRAIKCLETFFCFFGFYQSPIHRFLLSWAVFLLLGVSVPVSIFFLSRCSSCGGSPRIVEFDVCVLASQASLGAVSLACVSHNLHKYGMAKFLFVDKGYEELVRFHKQYVERIKAFFYVLLYWMLPGIIVKTAREIARISYVYHEQWWQSVALLLASILSWTYLTTIFLSGCNLFSLVCNLQVIHFEDYMRLLQNDSDITVLLEEHMNLCYYLSKISHRFRIHLLLVFFISTASQFATLFRTSQYDGVVDFINAGDFAVCSAVQVVGIILCLNATTKISHRAQALVSTASRWHALATCKSNDNSLRVPRMSENMEAFSMNQTILNHSRSNIKSPDMVIQRNAQLASYESSHHQRQALVMYLQSNNAGITIYGWTVDRGLINTIFCIELSLLLVILDRAL